MIPWPRGSETRSRSSRRESRSAIPSAARPADHPSRQRLPWGRPSHSTIGQGTLTISSSLKVLLHEHTEHVVGITSPRYLECRPRQCAQRRFSGWPLYRKPSRDHRKSPSSAGRVGRSVSCSRSRASVQASWWIRRVSRSTKGAAYFGASHDGSSHEFAARDATARARSFRNIRISPPCFHGHDASPRRCAVVRDCRIRCRRRARPLRGSTRFQAPAAERCVRRRNNLCRSSSHRGCAVGGRTAPTDEAWPPGRPEIGQTAERSRRIAPATSNVSRS